MLTLATLVVGVAVFWAISNLKPTPKARPLEAVPAPMVQVREYRAMPNRAWIRTQGTLLPKIEIDLVAEVAGKVASVDADFANGGYFKAGQALLSIDDADYRIALSQAKAKLADAKQLLATEKGRARQARREWRDLGDDEANDLFLRKPQIESAQSAVEAAEAGLEKARLDLQRTRLSVPFNGRIREKHSDLGEYLSPGSVVARVYSTDQAEIRLPLTQRQRELLLPAVAAGEAAGPGEPLAASDIEVILSKRVSGRTHEWRARLVRSEGALDPESRQLFVVASLDNPFEVVPGRPALVVGQFMQARISGREIDSSFLVPRSALRQRQQLWTVDANDRLQIIDSQVVQSNSDYAIVTIPGVDSLRIVESELSLPIEGMDLAVIDAGPQALEEPRAAAVDGPTSASSSTPVAQPAQSAGML